jgi:hypothetical protein
LAWGANRQSRLQSGGESRDPSIVSHVLSMIGINYQITDADLQASPICANAMTLLMYALENGGIQLAKSKAFNRKFVHRAAVTFNWPGYTADELYRINKVLNEDDFLPLMVMHDLLWIAKVGRHYKGKFMLTPKGRKLIGDFAQVQQTLFDALLCDYNHQNLDRMPDENHPDWEILMGVMDTELRDWVTIGHMLNVFYGMEIEKADYPSSEHRTAHWFSSRVVRPLNWLGLVESERGDRGTKIYEARIRKTPLWSKWLRFDHHQLSNVSRTIH